MKFLKNYKKIFFILILWFALMFSGCDNWAKRYLFIFWGTVQDDDKSVVEKPTTCPTSQPVDQ